MKKKFSVLIISLSLVMSQVLGTEAKAMYGSEHLLPGVKAQLDDDMASSAVLTLGNLILGIMPKWRGKEPPRYLRHAQIILFGMSLPGLLKGMQRLDSSQVPSTSPLSTSQELSVFVPNVALQDAAELGVTEAQIETFNRESEKLKEVLEAVGKRAMADHNGLINSMTYWNEMNAELSEDTRLVFGLALARVASSKACEAKPEQAPVKKKCCCGKKKES